MRMKWRGSSLLLILTQLPTAKTCRVMADSGITAGPDWWDDLPNHVYSCNYNYRTLAETWHTPILPVGQCLSIVSSLIMELDWARHPGSL